MPSLICSTRSMGLVVRRQPAAASKVRSAAAPSPVGFSDFNSGPPQELGHQLDLRGPALRLPGNVDIFFLAELLFANSGGNGDRPIGCRC